MNEIQKDVIKKQFIFDVAVNYSNNKFFKSQEYNKLDREKGDILTKGQIKFFNSAMMHQASLNFIKDNTLNLKNSSKLKKKRMSNIQQIQQVPDLPSITNITSNIANITTNVTNEQLTTFSNDEPLLQPDFDNLSDEIETNRPLFGNSTSSEMNRTIKDMDKYQYKKQLQQKKQNDDNTLKIVYEFDKISHCCCCCTLSLLSLLLLLLLFVDNDLCSAFFLLLLLLVFSSVDNDISCRLSLLSLFPGVAVLLLLSISSFSSCCSLISSDVTIFFCLSISVFVD